MPLPLPLADSSSRRTGICYAKADNKVSTHAAPQISGGITPGPPLPPPPPIIVKLLARNTPFSVNPTFASWNIDSSCNRGFHRIAFGNKNLRAAAKGLAPSTMRFGGSVRAIHGS